MHLGTRRLGQLDRRDAADSCPTQAITVAD